jgi:hypothetical protein
MVSLFSLEERRYLVVAVIYFDPHMAHARVLNLHTGFIYYGR